MMGHSTPRKASRDAPSTPELSPSKYISRLQKLRLSADSSSKKSIPLQLKRRRLERRLASAVSPLPNDGPLLFLGRVSSPPHVIDNRSTDSSPILSFISGGPLFSPEIDDRFEEGELDFSRLQVERVKVEREDEQEEIIEVIDDSDDSELQTPKQERGALFSLGKRAMSGGEEKKPKVRKADDSEEEQYNSPGSSPRPLASKRNNKASKNGSLKRSRDYSDSDSEEEEKQRKTIKNKTVSVPWPPAQTKSLWVGKLLEGDVAGRWGRILAIVNANGPERSQKVSNASARSDGSQQLQDKWHAIRQNFPLPSGQATGANAWSVQGQKAILQGFLQYGGARKSWDKVVTLVNQKDTSRVRTKKVTITTWQS